MSFIVRRGQIAFISDELAMTTLFQILMGGDQKRTRQLQVGCDYLANSFPQGQQRIL